MVHSALSLLVREWLGLMNSGAGLVEFRSCEGLLCKCRHLCRILFEEKRFA